ncbi:MAG: cysteine desulfurase, partial [Candidatus Schekmanbacteria bacterium RBG_13_48_7]
MIYLDNAATSFPKPPEVLEFIYEFYRTHGVNPGRSGYDLSLEAEQMVFETRKLLTEFFNGDDPNRMSFTLNASDSLNIAIKGVVNPGDHIITTNIEHNSVIRPVNSMVRDKIAEADFVPFSESGYVDPDDIKNKIKKHTKTVIVNHGSNVIGAVQALREIGDICRARGVIFIVDTCQTAGMIPIDMKEMNIDILTFTGHKSLYGPMGIGGMYAREGIDVRPLREGGTGVNSAYPYHLEEYPFRLECGTCNLPGIAGLNAGQKYLRKCGMENIYKHEMELLKLLQDGFSEIPRVKMMGTTSLENRVPVLSIVMEGMNPDEIGIRLDVDYDIAVRTGLECAPKV